MCGRASDPELSGMCVESDTHVQHQDSSKELSVQSPAGLLWEVVSTELGFGTMG